MLAIEVGNLMLRGYDFENNTMHEHLNVVGFSQYERALISSEKKQLYYGESAIQNRSFLTLYRPMINNEISYPAYLVINLKYLLKFKMCLPNLAGRPVTLLVHQAMSTKTRNEIKSLLLDSFGATTIEFAAANWLRLFNNPQPNILLIDISDSGVQVQCKVNNKINQQYIAFNNKGTRKIAEQLLYKHFSQTEIEQHYENSVLWIQEGMHGVHNDIEMNVEQLIMDNTDVINLIREVLISLPPWSRALMAQNIFVTGGISKKINIQRFGELIAAKLRDVIVSQNIQCKDIITSTLVKQLLTAP